MTEPLRRAGGLRPAEAGLAFFGAARPEFIAATLVDLAQRGYLGIAGTGDGDWVLTRCSTPGADGAAAGLSEAGGLLRYERTLLRDLFRRQSQARLSTLATTGSGVRAVTGPVPPATCSPPCRPSGPTCAASSPHRPTRGPPTASTCRTRSCSA
jgi:hypothetical protein